MAVGTAPKRDSQGPETHKDHPFLDGPRTALSEGKLCMNAHISSEVQLHLATQVLLKDQLLELENESRSVVSDSANPWTVQSVEFSRLGYWSG